MAPHPFRRSNTRTTVNEKQEETDMNIVTLFLALAILAGIILLCLSDRKKVKQFDERQLIVRSRAVNLAYVTLLICLFIVLILSTMTLPFRSA